MLSVLLLVVSLGVLHCLQLLVCSKVMNATKTRRTVFFIRHKAKFYGLIVFFLFFNKSNNNTQEANGYILFWQALAFMMYD